MSRVIGGADETEEITVTDGCSETWQYDNLTHQCFYHINETGECLCACLVRRHEKVGGQHGQG